MLVFWAYIMWAESNQPPAPDPTLVAEEEVASAEPAESQDWKGLTDERQPATASEPSAPARPTGSSQIAETPAAPPTPSTDAVDPWNEEFASDLFRVGLDNRGGGITSFVLLNERYTTRNADREWVPIDLVTRRDDTPPLFATPLEDLGLGDLSRELFKVDHASLDRVVFSFARDGIEIRKELRFARDRYEFDLSVEIQNHSNRVLETDLGVLWPGAVRDGNDFKEQSLVALVGEDIERTPIASVGSPGLVGGLIGGKEEGPATFLGDVHWAGMDLKFFVSALIPSEGVDEVVFEPLVKGQVASVLLPSPKTRIDPGTSFHRSFRAYLGPKTADELAAVGDSLDRSVNLGYSWLAPLTMFFHWLLLQIYKIVPNYGIAIIIVTVLVRVITLPIMQKQMKSMEKMRELQPRIKEIQEKFKEDRQKQSEEQMKLYKETGANPLGGCLPMLLQFPVFIGLFFALQSTIELRHAPFMLWIDDLSAPEHLMTIPGLGIPLRLLPLAMGASMVLQQRMTPMTGMDPAQARMMTTIMPIMMTVLFYRFPSGLVLYWFVSNLLGIAHQLWVRRNMDEAEA